MRIATYRSPCSAWRRAVILATRLLSITRVPDRGMPTVVVTYRCHALSGARIAGRSDGSAAAEAFPGASQHLKLVEGQPRVGQPAGVALVPQGCRGDVVVQQLVPPARAPAQRLDGDPQVGTEPDWVRKVPPVHAEALLAVVQPVRSEHLRQPEVRGGIGAVAGARDVKVPGPPEVILGAGAADRRQFAVPVKVELDLALAPPA